MTTSFTNDTHTPCKTAPSLPPPSHTHTHTHTRARARAQARKHTYTHTHTHTHTLLHYTTGQDTLGNKNVFKFDLKVGTVDAPLRTGGSHCRHRTYYCCGPLIIRDNLYPFWLPKNVSRIPGLQMSRMPQTTVRSVSLSVSLPV